MRIVCIGSCNIDMVYSVDHIAAPGETISATGLMKNWGGKGLNQAVAVARSFQDVTMAGMIHRDNGDLRDYMAENNLRGDLLAFSEQPTGHAVIYVDTKGQNSITIFGGANRALTETYVADTLRRFSPGDIVLIQNETNALDVVLRIARERELRVAMNPSPFTASLLDLPLDCVDFFFINEIEGNQITGKTQPYEILQEMRTRFPRAAIVLTLGSEGSICIMEGSIYKQHAYQVDVVDTTAAGDAFTGYFLAGIASDLGIPEALERASKAAAITVSRRGAVASIPYLDEVLAFEGKTIE